MSRAGPPVRVRGRRRRSRTAACSSSSVDDGPWEDVSAWVDPGYDGVLTDEAGNPLALREAFTGTSPSWPAPDLLVLDFGDALVGHTVNLSLRIGTDSGRHRVRVGADAARDERAVEPALPGGGRRRHHARDAVRRRRRRRVRRPRPHRHPVLRRARLRRRRHRLRRRARRGQPGRGRGVRRPRRRLRRDRGRRRRRRRHLARGRRRRRVHRPGGEHDGLLLPGYAAATAPVDCDDGDDGVHPGAEDLAGDGIDQDCSAQTRRSPTATTSGGRGGEEDRGGCGCGTGAAPSGLGLLGALALARRRRPLRG